MREQKKRLTKDDERGLFILDQPASLVYIDIHPFRIEWKVQISNIHKCWISSLIAQPWIASIHGTDRENGTPRLSESRNHNHVSHMSREWTERSPVGVEDLASYLLPKQFKLVHKPGPLVEAIISPIPMRSEEHTSELQSRQYLVCRLL